MSTLQGSSLSITVLKFGGGLLSSEEGREAVAARIERACSSGKRLVVVASAMGRRGDPYATDTLLDLARSVHADPDPGSLDLLLSTGESMSTAVLALHLQRRAVAARPLGGAQAGIRTSRQFGQPKITTVRPRVVLQTLEKGVIPIVAGFQGVTPQGEVTTLGRDGSDATAVALGVALRAEAIELYKDVEGIMSCDPCLVSGAHVIERIDYTHARMMASLGSKVVQPLALAIAERHGARIRVRGLNGGGGTEVIPESTDQAGAQGFRPLMLAHRARLLRVEIGRVRESLHRTILKELGRHRISVFSTARSRDRTSLYLEADSEPQLRTMLEEFEGVTLSDTRCAIVSVIGSGFADHPEQLIRIRASLDAAGIQVLDRTEQPTSLSYAIPDASSRAALHTLHRDLLPIRAVS
jgi:aspartate kinase